MAQDSRSHNTSPEIGQQQLITPEQAVQTLLSLHENHQLSSQQLKSDHLDILEVLTNVTYCCLYVITNAVLN